MLPIDIWLIIGQLLPLEVDIQTKRPFLALSENMQTSKKLELEIGQRLSRLRLARNVKQVDLAKQAGVGVRTLRRLEAGEPSTLDTFLRVASALNLEEAILSALPEGEIRPIERVSQKNGERRRARTPSEPRAETTWTWGDDTDD